MTYEMFRVAPIWWKSGRVERQMKRAGLILGVVFVMALAVVVGNRMSVDAMAVVVGVACGVLASIPTRVLLIWALGRKAGAGGYGDRSGHYPPIVVVNPGQSFGRPRYGSPPMYSAGDDVSPPAGPRYFKVVGDAETAPDVAKHPWPGFD